MTRRHTPRQQYHEALVIARDHGLIVKQSTVRAQIVWLVYRKIADGVTFLGRRSSVDGLRRFVEACVHTSAPERGARA